MWRRLPSAARPPAARAAWANTAARPPADPPPLDRWEARPALRGAALSGVYKELSKVRLSGLVVMSTMAGNVMAPGDFDPAMLGLVSAGTALCVASANSFNQWAETPYDMQMKRTASRPLVRGAISPAHGFGVGAAFGAAGVGLLMGAVNPLTAVLGGGNILLYAGVYTPMKRTSIGNTWVGSVVGAIPPVMGWTAATGSLDAGAVVLGAVLFAWQFPHFNALSWNLRGDYAAAGYRMMAVTHPQLCRRVALQYALAMFPISAAACYTGLTTSYFLLDSTLINGVFAYRAWRFYRDGNAKSARRLFLDSLWHLPALFALFILHKKTARGKGDEDGHPGGSGWGRCPVTGTASSTPPSSTAPT